MASEDKDVSMDAASSDLDTKVAGGEHEPGSDADSSDDSDQEDDKVSLQLVEQLEAALSREPTSYEGHVQYIAALRKAGLLEKLRAAREAMSARFPLIPTLWLEWTSDEARIASDPEDFLAVEALYERGVSEYLSIPLWLQYLEFVEEHDVNVAQCSPEGLTKMRKLFERALSAAGLHVTEGGKVWEAYREFEQAVLLAFADFSAEVKSKQTDCVRSLFHRELTVPLANHKETLEEYKAWEQEQGNVVGVDGDELSGVPSSVAIAYRKAAQVLETRQCFEERVADGKLANGELLKDFMEYIGAEEEGDRDPSRVQILYERALAVFPVTAELWTKYTQYLETNLKVPSIIIAVNARAVRNCPWVGTLWSKYLLALERHSFPETQISSVFEQCVQIAFESPLVHLDLFLTRVDGLRRRMMQASPSHQDVALLREIFERAVSFLSSYPELWDRLVQVHAYWADVEARTNKDPAAARGVWESLLKSSGRMVEAWQGYIAMEIAFNNLEEARAIYKRCYSRRFENQGTEILCDAWLRFEREHGSLEDYDRALLKVGPRVNEVKAMLTQQEAKAAALHQQVKDDYTDRKLALGKKSAAGKSGTDAAKRKRGPGYRETVLKKDTVPKKRAKIAKRETFDGADSSKGNASKQQDTVMDGEEQGSGEKETADTDMGTQKVSSADLADGIEQCVVFVKNLRFETGKEDLKEFFASSGGVKDVRLIKDKNTGRSRGFAYVEFESDDYVSSAVAKDGEQFMGRRISIARSNPKEKGPGAARGGRGRRGGLPGRPGKEETEDAPSLFGGRGRGGSNIVGHRRGGHVELKGSNTFAVPRAVARPLGWSAGKDKPADDSPPKSNEDFRNMIRK